jgi:hypothetical protein
MAITTTFLPEQVNTTSYNILKEFIYTYISSDQLDILGEFPILDEGAGLDKPILVLEDMSGSKKYPGMGRKLENGDRGQIKTLSFMASWIVTSSIGGGDKLRELADILEYIFLVYSNELSVAKLKKAKCSSLRTLSKTPTSIFWGGRHMISAEVTLRY